MTEKRKLVPLSCIRQMTDFRASFNYDNNVAAEHVALRAFGGTELEIVGVQAMNDRFEIVLVDMYIGDEFAWTDPIDVSALRGDPYFKIDIGKITYDTPLELRVCAFGTPSVLPFINLVFWGYETILDEEARRRHDEKAARKRGHIDASAFEKWLSSSTADPSWTALIANTLQDFIEGREPNPLKETVADKNGKIVLPRAVIAETTSKAKSRLFKMLAEKKVSQFNMSTFFRDFETLARNSPSDAASFVTQWRRHFFNAQQDLSATKGSCIRVTSSRSRP